MHWLFPLHSGTAFGTAGMVAMSLAGVAPLLLVLSGLWVWLRKRPGERLAAAHQRARAAARANEKIGV
jgi:LPXTG-motif cell wall-anchored protein